MKPFIYNMAISREEYRSLLAEFNYLCDLAQEAQRLISEMDYQEGVSLADGNVERAAKCKRLKAKAKKRHHRRSCKSGHVYEEMDQEMIDHASFGMVEIRWPAMAN